MHIHSFADLDMDIWLVLRLLTLLPEFLISIALKIVFRHFSNC